MDQIEVSLQELATKLTTAWRDGNCLTCPLAELAALAQATLVFYVEEGRAKKRAQLADEPVSPARDHWSNYYTKDGRLKRGGAKRHGGNP